MAPPHKRPLPPLEDASGTDAVDLKTEGSSEPPFKKLCRSPVPHGPLSSVSAGESSTTCLKAESSYDPPREKTSQSPDLHDPRSESAEESSPVCLKTEDSCQHQFEKPCPPQDSHDVPIPESAGEPPLASQPPELHEHPTSKSAREPSPACSEIEGSHEVPCERPCQSQNSHDLLSLESARESSLTCPPQKIHGHPSPRIPGQTSQPPEPAAPTTAEDDFSPDELEALEEQLAASHHSQATPTPAAADPLDVHDDGLSPDEFDTLERLTSPQDSQATRAAAATDAFDDDAGSSSDEFESLEELLTAPRTIPVPKREATGQPNPVVFTKTALKTPKSDAAQRNHAPPSTGSGVTSQLRRVLYAEADLEMPKIDAGEESDDSGVIDLTRDTEFEVGRSDGFIGTIKPGTPGITVKRKGAFQTTATPTRRALAPFSTNTPPPRQWDDWRSNYSGTTPSGPRQAYVQPGLALGMPEDARSAMQPYPGATPTYASGMVKHEVQGTPARDYKTGLVKFENEQKKPDRRRRPADASPTFDMAKFLVNEQNLAAMPRAAHMKQLKTRLLPHQRQALQWMVGMEQRHDTHSGPSARLAKSWKSRPRHNAGVDADPDTVAPASQPVTPFSGGILADDMGLGKTLEMIALILTEPKSGPTLIVAPKGVMSNWEKQIRGHINWKYAPSMHRFHGLGGRATPDELKRYDIVITTYQKVADEANTERSLRKVQWRRVILDEGHTIRNPDSKAALGACQLQAKSYWVCTGTPIINSENDAYSLGKFVGIIETLQKRPSEVVRRLKSDHQFLQDVMTTVCLRRTKEMSFINLELPPKHEEVIRIKFSEAENGMYQILLEDAKKAATMFFKSRGYALWNHLLERLLRLRQMCDHWTLCKKKGMEGSREELDEILRKADGNLDETQRTELLHLSLQANLACGKCNEPVDLECCPVIIPCAHVFCKACIYSPFRDTLTCTVCEDSFSTTEITELDEEPVFEYEVPDQHDHSAKTKVLIDLVKERLRNRGSKIVIFSQWTSFLNLIAHHLGEEDIQHTRIDGTMSTDLRDDATKALDKDPNVRVMLASLRAAGVGISLVSADTAILADSWWAPAIEEQAVDRVHRLGQTRPTKVYRLVIEGAVEEGVIQIQDRKRALVGTAFQEEFKALSTVSFSGMVKEVLGWSG